MPPVILWALGALGATVAGRWLIKEARRINAELHSADTRASKSDREGMPTLVRDPQTGIYRPAR